MRRPFLVVAVAAGAVVVSLAAISAHGTPTFAPSTMPSAFQSCLHHDTSNGASAKSHVPADLAKHLELTAEQQAEIDRLAADACSKIDGIHTQMIQVLTPEQQSRIRAMHRGGGLHDSTVVSWLRKLHGQ